MPDPIDIADRTLREYFDSLSPLIQNKIAQSSAHITTLGELMMIAEFYAHQDAPESRPIMTPSDSIPQ